MEAHKMKGFLAVFMAILMIVSTPLPLGWADPEGATTVEAETPPHAHN